MLTVIGVHVLSSIGEFLIWRSIPNLSNRQIKTSPKFPAIRYTVEMYVPQAFVSSLLVSLTFSSASPVDSSVSQYQTQAHQYVAHSYPPIQPDAGLPVTWQITWHHTQYRATCKVTYFLLPLKSFQSLFCYCQLLFVFSTHQQNITGISFFPKSDIRFVHVLSYMCAHLYMHIIQLHSMPMDVWTYSTSLMSSLSSCDSLDWLRFFCISSCVLPSSLWTLEASLSSCWILAT